MVYRCQTCRGYHRGEPYRRVGLGGVCSEQCATPQLPARTERRGDTAPDGVPLSTRRRVFERDGGCRFCGSHQNLHVHHIVYRSERRDHTEGNLVVLCEEHHRLVHSNKRRWQPVLQAYIRNLQDGHKAYLLDVERHLKR